MLETRLVLKEMRSFKKSDAKWNQGSGALRARPCPAKLPTCKNERREVFSAPPKRERVKRWWNLPPRIKESCQGQANGWGSLHGVPGRSLHENMKMKPGIH